MSTKFISATRLLCAAMFFLLLTGVTARAADKDLKLEVQLVLGSNEVQTNGKPVSPQIEKNSSGCRSNGSTIPSSIHSNFPWQKASPRNSA